MKKISKHLISLAILALLVSPVFVLPAMAQNNVDTNGDPFGIEAVDTGLGDKLENTNDPITIVTNVINIALGFLGVIAVGIILFGGFKWMTAAGNEDKVSEAQKLLGAGVIGLVIILASWALATFIIQQIYGATGGTGV